MGNLHSKERNDGWAYLYPETWRGDRYPRIDPTPPWNTKHLFAWHKTTNWTSEDRWGTEVSRDLVFGSQDLWSYTESSAEESVRKFVGEASHQFL